MALTHSVRKIEQQHKIMDWWQIGWEKIQFYVRHVEVGLPAIFAPGRPWQSSCIQKKKYYIILLYSDDLSTYLIPNSSLCGHNRT